jgi:hypothetical protein
MAAEKPWHIGRIGEHANDHVEPDLMHVLVIGHCVFNVYRDCSRLLYTIYSGGQSYSYKVTPLRN